MTPFQGAGGFSGSQPGVFGQFPTAPGPMPAYTPDMTFSMPDTGSMAPTGSGFGVESGAGVSSGAGLAGGVAGAAIGPIANIIGKQLGMDPSSQVVMNAAVQVLSPVIGGAVAGGVGAAGAGAGIGAGAAAGAAGGAAGGLVAAPVAVPFIVAMAASAMQKIEANRRAREQLQEFTRNIPSTYSDLKGMVGMGDAMPKDEAGLREWIAKHDQSANNVEGTLKFLRAGGTTSYYGEDATADFKPGPSMATGMTPALLKATLDRVRASDALSKITGEFEPNFTPEMGARMLGGATYNSSEEGASAFGNVYNKWMSENYPLNENAVTPAYTVSPGQEIPSTTDYTQRSFTPGAKEAFAGIQPGGLEQGLVGIFGGRDQLFGGDSAYWGGFDPTSSGAGALPGSEVGGAGKRSPQFLTPELDNRAEAATGKLSGGRPGQQDQGSPFGMGGAKRGGGMGVGAPMGGRPGGQSPFGGMSRQTMQPQQGGGVQAQRKQPSGVV